MEQLPDYSEADWLKAAVGGYLFAGLDPPGYPARARIFHAIYEDPRGRREPRGGSIGGSTGLIERPDDWLRIRWRDLASREGIRFDNEVIERGPLGVSEFWSPMLMRTEGWLESQQPPPIGSLDADSFARTVQIITREMPATDIVVYYCPVVTPNSYDDEPTIYRGRLSDLRQFTASRGIHNSPQNWWATDRSWIVYTDVDLPTTVISGPVDLINALIGDDWLECYRLPP
jgi:hypothetical protein